ncbi:hypothetical protein ACJMK2_008414 [Sinanodonta woodiana]|uniref:CBM20 domain-containing protein n=1 Tax=Sinanodonta woodiana TaxID=1069815 RepID=A0ABD3VPU5_SINWO
MSHQFVTIQIRTEFSVADCKGQRIGILGSHEALGCWDKNRPLLANNVWQNFWEVCFSVPSDTRIEWKWIVFEVNGKQVIQKESTPIRNLVAPNSDSYMSVPWEESEGFMMPLFKNTQYRTQVGRKHKETPTSSFTKYVLQDGMQMLTIPAEINSKPDEKSDKAGLARHQVERHDKVSANISSKSPKRKISKVVSPSIPRKVCKYDHEAVEASLANGIVPECIYDTAGMKISTKMEDSFDQDIKPTIVLDKEVSNTNLNAEVSFDGESSFENDSIPSNFHYKIYRNKHPANGISYEKDIIQEKVNHRNKYKEFVKDVGHSTDKIRTRASQSRASVCLAVPTIIFATGVLVYMTYTKLR